MIINRAKLIINESEYDILRFNYKFQRDTDTKGRPVGVYYGGEISVLLESTANIRLFEQMIHKDMPMVDGSIEVFSGEDEVCIRRIEFKEAYIYSYGEHLKCASWLPMLTTVAISPMRLDFNNTIRLDRKWPRANYWQNYQPEEVKYVRGESTPNVRITDAYWINENGNKVRDLVTDQEVTLYIVLEYFTIGQMIDVTFEDSDNMGVYRADCSGTVNKDGLLIIENFKMKKQ